MESVEVHGAWAKAPVQGLGHPPQLSKMRVVGIPGRSPTSPHSGIKSSFLIALIETTSCRIPVMFTTNHGHEMGDLVLL